MPAAARYSSLMPADLAAKKVTVMGLGRFGGGSGVARWLAGQGADVLVTDMQPREKLAESVEEIDDLVRAGSVRLRLGEHNVSDFTTCDLVIANPAVPKPWDNRFLRAAGAAGIPVTTEIRLLTERIDRRRVIGVTGSAGKSTTTAMIHHLLLKAGFRAHLGGNIGGTLLGDLPMIRKDDWIVLELSSAMLHWLDAGTGWPQAPGWSPRTAALTNISPNHIDWHGSFEHYERSKRNIFKHQAEGDQRIMSDMLDPAAPPVAISLPGAHNQLNARMAVATVARATASPEGDIAKLLLDFAGLPHRLQLAAEAGGKRFFNDSKCTTPEAALLAIAAFDDPSKIHLIAGGYDKGSDLSPIARKARDLAGLYAIGKTGETLAAAAGADARAEYCRTLENAVDLAMSRMRRGDILLLSPACASWDQFTNYEERGERFVRLVRSKLELSDQS